MPTTSCSGKTKSHCFPIVCLAVMVCLQYFWCSLMDFHQTFVINGPWDNNVPFGFGVKRLKVREGLSVISFPVERGIYFELCDVPYSSDICMSRKL